MSSPVSIFWFRRDLRLQDNAGLYHALRSGNPVVPVFIFDQIYLSRKETSLVDVLTRRRELESGYRFGTHFGINYRFGSKLNNFVNARFGRD